jgi:hypothetical protein
MLTLNPDVSDVVERFGIKGPDGVNILVMGTIVQAATGCLCPENALLESVVRYINLREGEVILMDTAGGGCKHVRYCRGGCPYNAKAPYDGKINGVDPHCTAYRRIFDEITDRLNKEMFESPDMEMTILSKPKKGAKPKIMSLMQKIVSR